MAVEYAQGECRQPLDDIKFGTEYDMNPNNCEIKIARAVVELYELCCKDWKKVDAGAIYLVKHPDAYYLVLYSKSGYTSAWRHAISRHIGYKIITPVFHIFSLHRQLHGLNFVDENEAEIFYNAIHRIWPFPGFGKLCTNMMSAVASLLTRKQHRTETDNATPHEMGADPYYKTKNTANFDQKSHDYHVYYNCHMRSGVRPKSAQQQQQVRFTNTNNKSNDCRECRCCPQRCCPQQQVQQQCNCNTSEDEFVDEEEDTVFEHCSNCPQRQKGGSVPAPPPLPPPLPVASSAPPLMAPQQRPQPQPQPMRPFLRQSQQPQQPQKSYTSHKVHCSQSSTGSNSSRHSRQATSTFESAIRKEATRRHCVGFKHLP